MLARRIPVAIIVLAWAFPLVAAEPRERLNSGASEIAAPAKSSSVLPHPDILQLPPRSDRNASKETVSDAAPSREPAADPEAQPVSAAPSETATAEPNPRTAEDKPITHRQGPAIVSRSATPETGEVARRTPAGSRSFFVDLWPLLVVLVLIGGMAWLLKRFMPARRMLSGSDAMQIVARTSVSPRQQLVMIKLGRRLLLLGVSPEQISTLTSVDDPDQVAMLLGEIASRKPDSMARAFASSMDDEARAYSAESAEIDDPALAHGQLSGLLKKVRQMAGKTAV